MITVKELREALAALPDNLPVVLTNDCWQWALKPEDMPKTALWTGLPVGTPQRREKLDGEREYMSDSYIEAFDKPCAAIGFID